MVESQNLVIAILKAYNIGNCQVTKSKNKGHIKFSHANVCLDYQEDYDALIKLKRIPVVIYKGFITKFDPFLVYGKLNRHLSSTKDAKLDSPINEGHPLFNTEYIHHLDISEFKGKSERTAQVFDRLSRRLYIDGYTRYDLDHTKNIQSQLDDIKGQLTLYFGQLGMVESSFAKIKNTRILVYLTFSSYSTIEMWLKKTLPPKDEHLSGISGLVIYKNKVLTIMNEQALQPKIMSSHQVPRGNFENMDTIQTKKTQGLNKNNKIFCEKLWNVKQHSNFDLKKNKNNYESDVRYSNSDTLVSPIMASKYSFIKKNTQEYINFQQNDLFRKNLSHSPQKIKSQPRDFNPQLRISAEYSQFNGTNNTQFMDYGTVSEDFDGVGNLVKQNHPNFEEEVEDNSHKDYNYDPEMEFRKNDRMALKTISLGHLQHNSQNNQDFNQFNFEQFPVPNQMLAGFDLKLNFDFKEVQNLEVKNSNLRLNIYNKEVNFLYHTKCDQNI